MFCQQCGSIITENDTLCKECGARVNRSFEYKLPDSNSGYEYDTLETKQKKNPVMAAFLGLVWCGMGQVYNGNLKKGLAYFFGVFIGLMFLTIPGIIIWLSGIHDAYATACKMNAGEIPYEEMKMSEVSIFAVVTIFVIVLFYITLQEGMQFFTDI